MQNKPPYDYLGYKILKSDVHREQDGGIELFSIKVMQGIYDEDKSIYSLDVTFSFKFKNNSPSSLFFRSAYKINDLSWKERLSELQLINTFFSVVFPYIRSTAEHITDDVRGKLIIPIIDLSQVNLTVGITFKPNQSGLQN